jgi:hypothetical protein
MSTIERARMVRARSDRQAAAPPAPPDPHPSVPNAMARPSVARLERILVSTLPSPSALPGTRPGRHTLRTRSRDDAIAHVETDDALARTLALNDRSQLWALGGEVARLVDGPNPWATKWSRKAERELNGKVYAHLHHARALGLELERYQPTSPRPADRRPHAISTTPAVDLPPHLSLSTGTPGGSSLAVRETHTRQPLLGSFSRLSLQAEHTRRIMKGLHRARHSDDSSSLGVTDDEWDVLRALAEEGVVNSSDDGRAVADLVKLGTLDAELASVEPMTRAKAADPDDFRDHQALLGLFLDRYVTLPSFVQELRELTLIRLFQLGLEPTIDIAEQLLLAAVERVKRFGVPATLLEVEGLRSQLQYYGSDGKDEERRVLLEVVLEAYLQAGPIAGASAGRLAIRAIERELESLSEGSPGSVPQSGVSRAAVPSS